jgi:hypothetical protein
MTISFVILGNTFVIGKSGQRENIVGPLDSQIGRFDCIGEFDNNDSCSLPME